MSYYNENDLESPLDLPDELPTPDEKYTDHNTRPFDEIYFDADALKSWFPMPCLNLFFI